MIEQVLCLLKLLLANAAGLVAAEGLELVLDVAGGDVEDEGKVLAKQSGAFLARKQLLYGSSLG